MSGLIGDLAAILGDGLLQTEDQRSARARDTWMRSQIPISAGTPVVAPLAVCAPSCSEELAEVVRCCIDHNTAMIPRGGGSGVVGGVLASPDSVVLSTERMTGATGLLAKGPACHLRCRHQRIGSGAADADRGSQHRPLAAID